MMSVGGYAWSCIRQRASGWLHAALAWLEFGAHRKRSARRRVNAIQVYMSCQPVDDAACFHHRFINKEKTNGTEQARNIRQRRQRRGERHICRYGKIEGVGSRLR